MQIEAIEKGGFDHFMLKETFEQPNSIIDSIRGRMSVSRSKIKMSGIDEHWEKWDAAQRILIIACGTSWHAGLVAEYLFEDFARIPVEVEYASEFRYRNPIIRPDDVVIAISSLVDADTLAQYNWRSSKAPMSSAYATSLDRASLMKRTAVRTHTPDQRLLLRRKHLPPS